MKKILRVFLIGIFLLGLSGVVLAKVDTSDWKQFELKDGFGIQFKLPPDIKQTKAEKDEKGNWTYEFRSEKNDKAVNVSVIFLAADGKKMGAPYPLEAGTDEMRGSFKVFMKEKSSNMDKMDYVKLESGRVVLIGKVNDAPVLESIGLTDSYLISMRVGVFGADGDTTGEMIFGILNSLNY